MVEALSQRIAREFREKISRGEWSAGARLPTTRELAAAYRVSVNTIQNAFRELEANDLVERRPRLGGFVKKALSAAAPRRTALTVAAVTASTDITSTAESRDDWAYRIIRGCQQELSQSGFHIAIFSYSVTDPHAAPKLIEKVEEAGESLAGLLCFLGPTISGMLSELDRRNLPWVTINRPKEHSAQNFVTHDAFNGARLAGRCFAKMGYRSAMVLSDEIRGGRSNGDKFFGVLEGWVESGSLSRHVDFVRADSYQEKDGYDAFRHHVEQFGPPGAVFATGDYLALGAIRACRELGLSVPNDVAVMGATGLQLAAYSHPSLTVLDTPMELIGRHSAQMLLEMAREGVRRMIGRYVPSSIIVRQSLPIPDELLRQEQQAIEAAT